MSGTSTGWANGRPVLAVPMGLVISGSSAALHTATTPASARARDASIFTMRAWASTLRRTPRWSMPSRRRSSRYRPAPVRSRRSSFRRGEAPSTLRETSVVVSHYIAINVAVGEAIADDRVVGFAPDNCSVTLLDIENGSFRLVERGAEAATRVL